MKNVLVIAPHADDETLGCGGTLLKHQAKGDAIHWLLLTEMSQEAGYQPEQIAKRKQQLLEVEQGYGFASVTHLRFPPAALEQVPAAEFIGAIANAIHSIKANVIYMPFHSDVHSDHRVAAQAVIACSKSFRAPFVERILAYETISETDYNLNPAEPAFRPNVYVDISDYAQQKLALLNIYDSEVGDFPFPRSTKAVQALESLRGSQCNSQAAEAFMLLKEIG